MTTCRQQSTFWAVSLVSSWILLTSKVLSGFDKIRCNERPLYPRPNYCCFATIFPRFVWGNYSYVSGSGNHVSVKSRFPKNVLHCYFDDGNSLPLFFSVPKTIFSIWLCMRRKYQFIKIKCLSNPLVEILILVVQILAMAVMKLSSSNITRNFMTVTWLSRFQLELDSKQTVSLNIRLAGIGFARKVNVKQLEANH